MALPRVFPAPPKAFRLLRMGANPTESMGVLWLTESSMDQCLSRETPHAKDLLINWNHDKKTIAGYFSLQGRPDGLWAVTPRRIFEAHPWLDGIFWTQQGSSDVVSEAYGNWSPEIFAVSQHGNRIITEVNGCALVNYPDLLGQEPLSFYM